MHLEPADRLRAFRAGQADRLAEIEQGKAKKKKQAETEKPKKGKKYGSLKEEGGIDRESSRFKEYQQYKPALEAISREYGLDIVVHDELTNKAGHQVNGYIENGTIHLSIHAVNKSVLDVFKHEFTHYLQETAPDAYQALKDFVFHKAYENDSEKIQAAIDEKMKQYEQGGQTQATRSDAMDELLADASMEFLQSEESIKEFVSENPSMAKKVWNALKEVIAKFKAIIQGLNLDSSNQWFRDLDILEEAEALWMKAAKASKGVEVGESGEIKFDVAIESHHDTQQQKIIKEYNSAVDRELVKYVENVYQILDKKSEEYVKPYIVGSVSERMSKDIQKVMGGWRGNPYVFDSTGYDIELNKDSLSHIRRRHAMGEHDYTMADIEDIARVRYVLDNYDEINPGGLTTQYKQQNPETGETEQAHTVIISKKIDGIYNGIEAVPDVNRKVFGIVSLYGSKEALQMTDVSSGTPGQTPDSVSESASIKDNVSQKEIDNKKKFSLSDPIEETEVKFSLADTLDADLQKVLDDTFPANKSELLIGETSKVLTGVMKAQPHPVTMPPNKAYSAMVTKEQAIKDGRYSKRRNYHGLGKEKLIEALERSEEPVAVVLAKEDIENEKKRSDRLLLVTDVLHNGNNIVVVQNVNSRSTLDGKQVNSNKVITVFDRNYIQGIIKDAIATSTIYDYDPNKISTIADNPDRQTIDRMSSAYFENNIQQFWANVNYERGENKAKLSTDSGQTKSLMEIKMEEARQKKAEKEKSEKEADVEYSLPTVQDMEAQSLKDKIEAVKSEMRLTHGKIPNERESWKLAKRLHEEWMIEGMTVSEIDAELREIYRLMNAGSQVDNIEEIYAKLMGLTGSIMERGYLHPENMGDDFSVETAREMKAWLRNAPFYMSEGEKADIAPDGFGRFRKENFGRLRVVNDISSSLKAYS